MKPKRFGKGTALYANALGWLRSVELGDESRLGKGRPSGSGVSLASQGFFDRAYRRGAPILGGGTRTPRAARTVLPRFRGQSAQGAGATPVRWLGCCAVWPPGRRRPLPCSRSLQAPCRFRQRRQRPLHCAPTVQVANPKPLLLLRAPQGLPHSLSKRPVALSHLGLLSGEGLRGARASASVGAIEPADRRRCGTQIAPRRPRRRGVRSAVALCEAVA